MSVQIVRFNGRYYVDDAPEDDSDWDSDGGNIGQGMVNRIPSKASRYGAWLKRMREKYTATERHFDRFVFPISGAPPDPRPAERNKFLQLPSALPRVDRLFTDHNYIINLDQEIFTVEFGAHFKLGNIPREDNTWRYATVPSIYPGYTVATDLCDEDQLASPAVELPQRLDEIGYASRTVVARVDVNDTRKRWLVRVLAEIVHEYATVIIHFGREWAPDALPFREITFALLWVASGNAKFLSFPEGLCHRRNCLGSGDAMGLCENLDRELLVELPEEGYFDRDWAGDSAPLLEFGTLFHQAGRPPGAAPAETMYWFDDVLVSLVLVVDGSAVAAAVTWGLEQGHCSFQLIVISLFEIIFAEVSMKPEQNGAKDPSGPSVKVSQRLKLSPLREEECMSTHPKQRPEQKEGMGIHSSGPLQIRRHADRCNTHFFPGLEALVTFFDVAAKRQSAAKTRCVLPPEILCHIMDEMDYETWRTCSRLSPVFRSYSHLKYRIDDDWRVVPANTASQPRSDVPLFSFEVENMSTAQATRLREMSNDISWGCHGLAERNWMPIVGAETRALMVHVLFEFFEDDDEEDENETGGSPNEVGL